MGDSELDISRTVTTFTNNRIPPAGHPNHMRFQLLCAPTTLTLTFALICVVACTTKQNPDELREKTAQATAEMRRDAKAVAEGVKEGLERGKSVDLNSSSREQLLTLPGLTGREADRIIAGRPYDNAHQLITRQLISQEEYEKIKDRVTASR
jgi:DNA uptake protein ComE-like DNA-binding protein